LQEALRSQGHRTPVILITAYPNERRRNRAIDGGAVGFLSKPFDEASLIECLAAAINLMLASHTRRGGSRRNRQAAGLLRKES
jgi:FixJ family two-component response regulator